MPAWLINLLVKLAVSIGLPYLVKKFPGLPSEIWKMIEEILSHIKDSDDKPEATRKIQSKVRECTGVGCAPRIKK